MFEMKFKNRGIEERDLFWKCFKAWTLISYRGEFYMQNSKTNRLRDTMSKKDKGEGKEEGSKKRKLKE